MVPGGVRLRPASRLEGDGRENVRLRAGRHGPEAHTASRGTVNPGNRNRPPPRQDVAGAPESLAFRALDPLAQVVAVDFLDGRRNGEPGRRRPTMAPVLGAEIIASVDKTDHSSYSAQAGCIICNRRPFQQVIVVLAASGHPPHRLDVGARLELGVRPGAT